MKRIILILVGASSIFSGKFWCQDSTFVSEVELDSSYVHEIDSLWLKHLGTHSLIYEFRLSLEDSIEVLPQTSEQFKKGFDLLDSKTPLSLEYNPLLDPYINEYLRHKSQLKKLLGLGEYYFPSIEAALDRHGIPLEVKCLSVVESALNPNARSPMGATGLWQFMLPTGRQYGLIINSYMDERKDPTKATEAAARYLRDLYDIYGVWELAIAAYNCGPGNVNKAIRNAGGSRNFWEIRPYLPRETQKYVPRFMSMCYLMEFGEKHGVAAVSPDFNYWQVDTIKTHKQLDFKHIIECSDITHEDLIILNPQFKLHTVPASEEGVTLRIPAVKMKSFVDNRDKILSFSPEKTTFFVKQRSENEMSNKDLGDRKRITYTVRKGDVLGTISERHKVSIRDLKRWNGISGTRIKAGQKLKIYLPKTSQKKAEEDKPDSSGWVYHTVSKGDTLWDIAKKYPSVSAEDIKRQNKGINPKNLKTGSKLKIRKS